MSRPEPKLTRRQRGLSLVEMMVGIAVGLFVVAAAAMLVATQLSDNRRLLLETQMQQDLRASMDIITRELRRAGAQSATAVLDGLATAGGEGGKPNAYSGVTPNAGESTEAGFSYMRAAGEQGPYGFKLEGGVIKTRLATAGWQELTDPNTLRITEFKVTARNADEIRLPCPRLCAGGGTACWPTAVVREFEVQISGQATGDASVRRSLNSRVRLRNDWVRFNDAANPNQICPS